MEGVSMFSSNADSVLSRTVGSQALPTDHTQLDVVYEINRTLHWIKENGFKRVALQFPDELMGDAVSVTKQLERLVPEDARVFILGDTSYGSCCVDEVAAQHYNADCLVHYGRSCLSVPARIATQFVFGRLPLDLDDLADKVTVLFPSADANVILVYDSVFQYACDDIVKKLPQYTGISLSVLAIDKDKLQPDDKGSQIIQKCSRVIKIPQDKQLESYSFLYIGSESLTLTNLMYNFQSSTFFSYNPITRTGRKESVNVNKMLMKRYFMIEKAKDANIVGILVGTLGVANYLDILNRLKLLIKNAGKKSYVFIVGKINVAKLANFMEVDVFVLIACAENSLLDSSDFYKPVVTPYEMELACIPGREWTGEYPTAFGQLLEGGSHHMPVPDKVTGEETDVSLVTGRIRRSGVAGDVAMETGSALMVRDDTLTVATQAQSAGEYLSMRSWKGLEQKLGETPVTRAVEGQKGIAMGYQTEPGNP
ncbi:2-(3-amino-3-carboxypropyl)histidine synthase subunit 2-like [Dreissena polymorpha]|uniref:2-(3-amino-3-carboxypropyl)histidine synthase subunit 2 n=1 Tax=Dreissena polymorpha TaxID=45954 RepID=A0A9D3YFU0_DREPO|nr:2-(3-amino-3-carboxypropyl)histidine synthase subunit 2-like [Dreissena polymorpha]KAH3697607.1 hypothetical protein DPMN_085111 [Dreissena polymorpha]